jgi:hypothetical protein
MSSGPPQPAPISRARLLIGATALGGAALGGGLLTGGPREARAQSDRERDALRLILLVEYTEQAFYAQAVRAAGLRGELRDYASEVAGQEREHLDFVMRTLGADVNSRPSFDFQSSLADPDAFAASAARLEDLAVAAYNGQGANLSREMLARASTIVSVEARHAAWIRSIVGEPPAPEATDTPRSADDVLAGLERIGLKR